MLTSKLLSDGVQPSPKPWTHGIVESTPLSVDDHLSTTGLESLVLELGQLAQVLDVSSVRSGSEDRTKQTTTGGVRSREQSADGLRGKVRTATPGCHGACRRLHRSPERRT